jgi:hypothetical protein
MLQTQPWNTHFQRNVACITYIHTYIHTYIYERVWDCNKYTLPLTRPYGTVKAIEERNAYRKRLTAKSKTRNTNKLRLKTSWSTRRREEGRGEESGVRDSYASSSARARGFIYIAWMWFPFRDLTRMPLKPRPRMIINGSQHGWASL